MASGVGGKWEGVKRLIQMFSFAKETQASLQTELEVDQASKETPETSETEEPRMEQSTPEIGQRRSYEKDVQKRGTNSSDKRRGIMFQESSEHIATENIQNDFESAVQLPTERRILSMGSIDLSVTNNQETTNCKLIVLGSSKNVIEQTERETYIKFDESIDTKKEALQKDSLENKDEFELVKLQDEVTEVTRLVLQMESTMREAKDRLLKLSQLLEDKKTDQQRNRNKQLQINKDEIVKEMRNKETQTGNADNLLEEILEALHDNTLTQTKQDQVDCTEKCIFNEPIGEIDSEELTSRKDQTKVEVQTRVAETRKMDRDDMHNATQETRILVKRADSITVINPNYIKAEDKCVVRVNEEELQEKQPSTKSDKTANTGLGEDRQENYSYDAVADTTQLKRTHLETTLTGTIEQTDGHVSCSQKFALKETDEAAIHIVTELRRNQKTEDTEIGTNCENQCMSENTFEESMMKMTSDEKNLDSNAGDKYEQCMNQNVLSVDETEIGKELTEKSDTVQYQFVATNQVNQYIDFSDSITKELDLKNKRKSEYYAKGWNVDVRKEVYSAENKLHEIDLNMDQTQSRQSMSKDQKESLDEAISEQRPDEETQVKSGTNIESSELALIVSEKEDKILSVKPCDDASKAIWGVAKINDELFLLRDSSLSSEVWLLKEESFEFVWKVRGRPLDMAGDSRNRWLYICRGVEPDNDIIISVHDINESERPSEIQRHSWRVSSDRYVTLSITEESNVLLTLMESRKLVEYTYKRGVEKVHRDIEIPDIANPLHAVKQSNDTYVVCHGENRDEMHRVCIVNASGHLLKYFSLRTASDGNMSVAPMYLALGKEGSIIVAENRRGRVVQLNSDLEVENVLMTMNDGLRGPCRIHLDETNGQMIVADNEHGWRDGMILIRDI